MSFFRVSPEQKAQFEADGYIVVPSLLNPEEADLLQKLAKSDMGLADKAYGRPDRSGMITKLALRNDLPDDIFGAITRSRRVVDAMEILLDGEVYHYHHKMTMKEPLVGGAWEWHQDYGYWYNNGCLFPYMASCWIDVDKATQENGCMQVIKGSHHMGRIEHGVVAGQTGADLERVEKCLEHLELVYCEMEPGDALFFHSNTLHRSDMNRSANPRWSLISCYNAARNNPYKQHGHPCYSFLEKWEDEKVLEVGRRDASKL